MDVSATAMPAKTPLSSTMLTSMAAVLKPLLEEDLTISMSPVLSLTNRLACDPVFAPGLFAGERGVPLVSKTCLANPLSVRNKKLSKNNINFSKGDKSP